MTNEYCLTRIREIKKEYDIRREALNEGERVEIASLLNRWANENARFSIGDIIETDSGRIIRIDKILGYKSQFSNNLYCVYYGFELTKKLNQRKDKSRETIYDDGRAIKLIKAKEKSV